MRTADFGTRFSAWMIDAGLLFSLQWIVVIVASRQLQAVGMVERNGCEVDPAVVCEGPSTALWVMLFGFVVVSTFGYHVWFDGLAGASPGKRFMGLRVVGRTAADDTPIGALRGVTRAMVRQCVWVWTFLFLGASPIAVEVSSPVFFESFALAMSTFVWGAYSPSGAALHDLVARTSVVHRVSLTSHVPSPTTEVAP